MPITERRLRLSRHVHAPYTTKGKERCTSTDTPRACIRNPIQSSQMLSIWLCILLGFFSNLFHWSSVYHSLLLGGPLQNRHKHRSCDRTDGKQESFSSGSTAKHLTIWRDNVRKNFHIAWRDECFFLILQCLSPWLKKPKMAQTSSAACLNGAAFGSLFLKEVSRLTSAVSRYSKTDFFFFLLWEKQIRGFILAKYMQN